MRFVIAFISLIVVLSSCNTQKLTIPDKGIPLELAQERADNISDINYHLVFRIPDQKSEAIEAEMNIKFELKETTQVILDYNSSNGEVQKVMIGGESIQFLDTNQHIIIPKEFLITGQNQIDLNFIAGDLSLNRNDDYLYTLFVPARASSVFPLFDQPDLKASFELTLEVPEEWTAQSNGRMLRSALEDGRKTILFEKTKPIPSYLFAFSAGKFQRIEREVDGRFMEMLHRETDSSKVERNVDEIFRSHSASLKWLEEYTGISYPFEKFGFTLIPSFQYGGMEHPGAIFYNASSLFLDEDPSVNQELRRAGLIAHETAHMWFGDLVTMKWFDDVWLKEVFANFMAGKMVNPQFPEIDHELRFTLSHYRSAYAVDRTEGTHPVRQELDNLSNAGSLYGSIIYQKAPILMKHLELLISESTMKRGLQRYLNQYSYGNATWDDLVNILDEESVKDVKEWSEKWVYGKGMPTIEISRDHESLRFVQDETLGSQDLKYFIRSEGGDTTLLTVNPTSAQSVIGIDSSSVIIPNIDGFGYGYFPMDPVSLVFALDSIRPNEERKFAAVRINLMEMVIRGDLIAEKYLLNCLNLIPEIENEQILNLNLGQIQSIYWRFLTDENRIRLAEIIEQKLWDELTKAETPVLKRMFFRSFRDVALTSDGVEKLKALHLGDYQVEGLNLTETDKITNVYELAVRGVEGNEELMRAQWETIKNPDRKRRMEFVMPALSNDPSVRDAFFESLKEEANREQEPWVQQALAYLNHPLRKKEAEKYLRTGLELLIEIERTGDIFFPQRWLNSLFSGHNSENAVGTVEEFLIDYPDYPEKLKNKILQSTDPCIRANKVISTDLIIQ